MLYDTILLFDKLSISSEQVKLYFSSTFLLACNNGVFELLLDTGVHPSQVFNDNTSSIATSAICCTCVRIME